MQISITDDTVHFVGYIVFVLDWQFSTTMDTTHNKYSFPSPITIFDHNKAVDRTQLLVDSFIDAGEFENSAVVNHAFFADNIIDDTIDRKSS